MKPFLLSVLLMPIILFGQRITYEDTFNGRCYTDVWEGGIWTHWDGDETMEHKFLDTLIGDTYYIKLGKAPIITFGDNKGYTKTRYPIIHFYSSDSTYTAYLGMGDVIDTSQRLYLDPRYNFHLMDRFTYYPFWTSAVPIQKHSLIFWIIVVVLSFVAVIILLFTGFETPGDN